VILDAIIGLFVSAFGLLAEGLAFVFGPLLNLIAAGAEAIIGLFVSGFSVGRIQRKKRETKSAASIVGAAVTLILMGMLLWLVVGPKLMNRPITLVAADGHGLPFAAAIIHTDKGDRHERTDNAGNIVIPRFGSPAITVKDPRYIEKRWSKKEIISPLIVERTLLGSGLDSMAEQLLAPVTRDP
jgi:hypothetical protein